MKVLMLDLPISPSGAPAVDIATEILMESGRILISRFNENNSVRNKLGNGDIVTDADIIVEHSIIAQLMRHFPDDGFVAEESDPVEGNSGFVWVVDPLDGTRNYSMHIPFFCTTLALTRNEEVLMGLTYDPMRGELFKAIKGKGSFLNQSPVRPSRKKVLSEAMISYDLGNLEHAAFALEMLVNVIPKIGSTRLLGSAALGLAYAACGRTDIYFHNSLMPWDLASGLLLVSESGGLVSDKKGVPASLSSTGIIASGHDLHASFLTAIENEKWRY